MMRIYVLGLDKLERVYTISESRYNPFAYHVKDGFVTIGPNAYRVNKKYFFRKRHRPIFPYFKLKWVEFFALRYREGNPEPIDMDNTREEVPALLRPKAIGALLETRAISSLHKKPFDMISLLLMTSVFFNFILILGLIFR